MLHICTGVVPALVQGPMSRFGDTAANTGVLALLESYDSTKGYVHTTTIITSATITVMMLLLIRRSTTVSHKQSHNMSDARCIEEALTM